jgi:hypothetical protein
VLTIDTDRAPLDLLDEEPNKSQYGVVGHYAGLSARSGIDFGRTCRAFTFALSRITVTPERCLASS